MAHVPDAYLAGVAGRFPQWTAAALALVRVCKADTAVFKEVQDSKLDHLVYRINWDKRALSAITSAKGTQKLSAAVAIKDAFDEAGAEQMHQCVAEASPAVFFAGWDVDLRLQADWDREAVGPDRLSLDAYVSIINTCAAAGDPFSVTHAFSITCAAADGAADEIRQGENVYSHINKLWGFEDFLRTGKMAAWDASKFQRWTGAAGDMTFTFEASIV
jgi:hypothetical protein